MGKRSEIKKLDTILNAAERRIKAGKGISQEEFWKRVGSSEAAAEWQW